MIKAEFSASLLQSSVSHDPSEIILNHSIAAQETFLLLSMLKTFPQDSLMNRKLKGTHLFEVKIFCNIINVFVILMHPC